MVPNELLDQLWCASSPVFPIPNSVLNKINTKLPENPEEVRHKPNLCVCDSDDDGVGEDLVHRLWAPVRGQTGIGRIFIEFFISISSITFLTPLHF